MKHHQIIFFLLTTIAFLLLIALVGTILRSPSHPLSNKRTAMEAASSTPAQNLFLSVQGELQEVGSSTESANPDWWPSSGGYFYVATSGVASTIMGSLPSSDAWRLRYFQNNPVDTDEGYHPQNVFRLISQSKWQNYTAETYFLIKNNNFSASPNRNQSNGLFLLNRYQDANNLYDVGVRVDGAAVIKKKANGVYYTMAYRAIFPGTYDRTRNPNLLPIGESVGLRTNVTNNATGSVTIVLSVDIGRTGNWKEVLSATDDGIQYGGKPISVPGNVGIRTDFMDVEFGGFRVTSSN